MKLSDFLAQINFVATPDAEVVIYYQGREVEITHVERAVTYTNTPIRIVIKN